MTTKPSLNHMFQAEDPGQSGTHQLGLKLDPDYKLLFESDPGFSLVVQPDAPRFAVVAMSDAFARAAGWTKDDVIGRGLLELLPDNGPSDQAARKHIAASLQRVTATGAPDTLTAQQLCIGHAANQERWLSATNTPVFGFDGQLRYIVHRVEDMTNAVRRERLRDEWLTQIAHDLLQPLNTISGYAQLLCRSRSSGNGDDSSTGSSNGHGTRYAQRIQHATDVLARMIGDLLDASRVDAQTMALACSDVDLSLVVRRAVDQLPELSARCRVNGEHNSAIAWADAARIEQVLDNLLTNAIKYSEAATPIDVTIAREDSAYRITVENDGPGIAAADLTHIFNRFDRGRRARADGVSGLRLGLHICKGLVEAHGGRIWAESNAGRKTRFHFTVPLAR